MNTLRHWFMWGAIETSPARADAKAFFAGLLDLANVAPRLMSEMCRAALAGDLAAARAINNRLLPLHFKLFVEANPIPVKWALQRMGRIGGGIRLPLTPLSEAYHETVLGAMKDAGVVAR